jgi:hypothetical protein
MVVHHAQLLKTGIPSNAVGQQLVQQVQFNATQSAIKVVGIWFELQNGIVPTSWLPKSANLVSVVKASNDDGIVPVSALPLNHKVDRAVKASNDQGMVPFKLPVLRAKESVVEVN